MAFPQERSLQMLVLQEARWLNWVLGPFSRPVLRQRLLEAAVS
jgi:hypothetical protein